MHINTEYALANDECPGDKEMYSELEARTKTNFYVNERCTKVEILLLLASHSSNTNY